MQEIEKIIPPEIYYRKIISRDIGGFCWDWEGGFHFYLLPRCVRYKDDDELFLQVLEERTDDEITSYFYSQHDNGESLFLRRKAYECAYEGISKINPRIAELLKKAYTTLCSEKRSPQVLRK